MKQPNFMSNYGPMHIDLNPDRLLVWVYLEMMDEVNMFTIAKHHKGGFTVVAKDIKNWHLASEVDRILINHGAKFELAYADKVFEKEMLLVNQED